MADNKPNEIVDPAAAGRALSDNDTPAERARREADDKEKADLEKKAAADAKKAEQSEDKPKSGSKFYVCRAHSQLSVQVGDEVVERFVPYRERWQGEEVRVGYLATDNKDVQKRLAEDGNVEELSKADFEKATGPKSFRLPVQAS